VYLDIPRESVEHSTGEGEAAALVEEGKATEVEIVLHPPK